ncbi:hypothetical protein BCR39DRAFT_550245 [Naematelia encephala]|uniref:RING-type domain-containing protein n=1 Tax=Naematelia encephala TaxID=71784 RepID=A0A1Y2AL59_9TREE|nr:hypothetical protein BCR39DRAFT_550245 [Naematelia encephala]
MSSLPFILHRSEDPSEQSSSDSEPDQPSTMRPTRLDLATTDSPFDSSSSQDLSQTSPPPLTGYSLPTSRFLVTPSPASTIPNPVSTSSSHTVRPKPFPHSADLLGSASESLRRPSPRPVSNEHEMDVDMPVANDLEASSWRLRRLRRQENEERNSDLPRMGYHRAPRSHSSQAPLGEVDQALENPGWNELGTLRSGLRPTAFRPRPDFENLLGDTLPTNEIRLPPVVSRRHTPQPIRIPPVVGLSSWISEVPQIERDIPRDLSYSPPSVPPPRPSFTSNDDPHDSSLHSNNRSRESGTSRGQYLSDRLARLDALRTQAERLAPDAEWTPPTWRYWNVEQFDNSHDEPAAHGVSASRVASARFNDWHRTVQDAVGRRVSADPSHQNVTPLRPGESESNHHGRNFVGLWGEIPIDSSITGLHDPQHPWDRRSGNRLRLPRSFAEPETRLDGVLPDLDPVVRPPRERGNGFDQTWLDRHWQEMPSAYAGIPEPTLRRLDPTTILSQIKLRPDMPEAERLRVVKLVVRYMSKCPSDRKQPMVESTLEHKSYVNVEVKDKDAFCSVCHDEYEPDTKIAMTPCDHMYHRNCLETWLQTSNGTSCPMCRRDLAVLACLTKMVPGKTRDEAMPLWLAI